MASYSSISPLNVFIQISMNAPMVRNSAHRTVRILQAPTLVVAGLDTDWAVMVEVAMV
jgi:hypothetical protein